MNNKEALTEDISNIMYGTPTDKYNGTSIIPNDRVLSELEGLVRKEAIAFAEWISQNGYRPCDKVFGTFENDSEIEVEFTSTDLYSLYQSTINKEQ